MTRASLPPSDFDSKRALTEVGRQRAAKTLSWGNTALSLVSEQHTDRVVRVDATTRDEPRRVADAMVTQQAGRILGITTADCVPILLADPIARVIGAAHAGWRGARAGVVENTLAAMVTLGAQPAHIVAVIGPCIAQASYELGPERVAQFLNDTPTNGRYFVPSAKTGHCYFDLPGYVKDRLRAGKVGAVADMGCNTYTDPERFYSYRYVTHRGLPYEGNLLSVIMLEG